MVRIIDADEAIKLIKDGDTIGINSFLSLGNPEELHSALARRISTQGHPRNLKIFCSAGFGGWDESRFADPYVNMGAVSKVVASHFSSMPAVVRGIAENKIEGYNLPLGVLTHCVRAAAAGSKGLLSKIGINLFVDPRIGGPAMNEISKEELVKVVEVEGEEYLYYKTPEIDIAFIKGTTVDPNGNISFEKECVSVDALSLAQATKANGGKVIVQVEGVTHIFNRPRNVVVPGILVDAVVVSKKDSQLMSGEYNPTLSGDIHVPSSQMDYWMSQLGLSGKRSSLNPDPAHILIGMRAAQELRKGMVCNIGVGIPEIVGKCASETGILNEITLTVESGGIGGLPAPGVAFGATIGADFVCDMAQQFDLYNGGGLDICFLGGLEVDSHGNVNAHQLPNSYVGIGGFANISYATKNVVFCITFATKGLKMEVVDGEVSIRQEGQIPKFKKEVLAISFSGKNAIAKGQNVLYVTERCVFKLGSRGLKLIEVARGIDVQRDILDHLDFPVEIELERA